MNKRLPLLLLATSLASTSAFAADSDWTGWYVGGHLGHGSGDSRADVTTGGAWSSESADLVDFVESNGSADLGPSGTTGGVMFGYDHQFSGNFVLGVELDYSHLGIEDARQTGPLEVPAFPALEYDFGNSIELDNRYALRGRFGFATGPHLFYATAGWVRVDAEATATVESNGNYLKAGGASESLDGMEWGAGYEFDLGNAWSLRLEYLATDLDDMDYVTDYLPGSSFTDPAYIETVSQDLDFETIRLGFSYRF